MIPTNESPEPLVSLLRHSERVSSRAFVFLKQENMTPGLKDNERKLYGGYFFEKADARLVLSEPEFHFLLNNCGNSRIWYRMLEELSCSTSFRRLAPFRMPRYEGRKNIDHFRVNLLRLCLSNIAFPTPTFHTKSFITFMKLDSTVVLKNFVEASLVHRKSYNDLSANEEPGPVKSRETQVSAPEHICLRRRKKALEKESRSGFFLLQRYFAVFFRSKKPSVALYDRNVFHLDAWRPKRTGLPLYTLRHGGKRQHVFLHADVRATGQHARARNEVRLCKSLATSSLRDSENLMLHSASNV